MMLPVLEIPDLVEKFSHSYQSVFSKPQFLHFKQFLTGLLIHNEANIDALAKGYRHQQSYDSLHHFVSESPWDINDVLTATVDTLKNLPDHLKLHEKGVLIIDDSLIEKFGKMMEAVGKLHDHSTGRYLEYAHCLVALTWSDGNKRRYPLRFELYEKKTQENQEVHQTKIDLARTLIDWAIEQGIPFRTVLFDSWYFTKDFVDHIESLGKDWISMSKSNRLLMVHGEKMQCGDYAQTRNPKELREVIVGGKTYAISSKQMRMPSLKREMETIRVVVSFEKKDDDIYKNPIVLVSNNKKLRPEVLIKHYQLRWSIETFFKDAKSHLGLGEYQMRRLKGIKSHWCLVFTAAILLELTKWESCTKKGLDHTQTTMGALKQRAFGTTLRSIIHFVITATKTKQFTEEEIFERLGV